MPWVVVDGTNGAYEFNADTHEVRSARTHVTLKERAKAGGSRFYRISESGKKRDISFDTIASGVPPLGESVGVVKRCTVCGSEFIAARSSAKYCSKKCKHRHDNAAYQPWLRERCRKNSVRFSAGITLDEVVKKYEGTCQMCGKRTDRGGPMRDWPTIDHIRPLSRGGDHSWDNVQLLCYSCNSKKGDQDPGSEVPPA